jgi:hypothetical protein
MAMYLINAATLTSKPTETPIQNAERLSSGFRPSQLGLHPGDRPERASLHRHVLHGSRSTDRRMLAHCIPASNPSRPKFRSQHIWRRHFSHKAGFDLTTTLHIRSRNSQVVFHAGAYSCSNSAQASSQQCQPGAGSRCRSRSNRSSRPFICE